MVLIKQKRDSNEISCGKIEYLSFIQYTIDKDNTFPNFMSLVRLCSSNFHYFDSCIRNNEMEISNWLDETGKSYKLFTHNNNYCDVL